MVDAIPQNIYNLLKTVVVGKLENYSVTVHDKNRKGDGFLGEMCYVSLEDKSSGKKYDLAVKQAFKEDILRQMPIRNMFLNEIHFYTKIWATLDKFQNAHQLQNPFNKIAKCFATCSEDKNECLVLENLKVQNFQMRGRSESLDEEHYTYIFENYGIFHAVSFAYRHLHPEEFAELSKGVTNDFSVTANMEGFQMYIKSLLDQCLKYLDPETHAAIIAKYSPYVEKMPDIFKKACSYTGNYSSFVHGDCWSNNLMFTYNKSNKITDMRLLDFQQASEGTPAWDLSYCLYAGATKETLANLDHYLKLYHDSFSKTIEAFGLKPEDVYPLRELKKDWREYSKMGFVMGLTLWKNKLTKLDEIQDIRDMISQEKDGENKSEPTNQFDEETYAMRCRDLILHMYENDFF